MNDTAMSAAIGVSIPSVYYIFIGTEKQSTLNIGFVVGAWLVAGAAQL